MSLQNLQASTIDEVIKSLDKIVEWSIANQKRTGYFAALYRKVTFKVKEGIEAGDFENGERMERLDVTFANRYLEAFEQYQSNQPMTKAWQLAFSIIENKMPIVLLHLMLGMNAHINLDLGIAAAETVPSNELPQLKNDFDKINTLLASLVDEVQKELGEIWPLFNLIDAFAGRSDEMLANFGMEIARGSAWQFAESYAAAINDGSTRQALQDRDEIVTCMGNALMNPGLLLRAKLFLIRIGERGSVAKKIQILA